MAGPYDEKAAAILEEFFETKKSNVFYGRQIEILFEDDYFHWVTTRAIRTISSIKEEWHPLAHGGQVKILFHKSNRYYKRSAEKLIATINSYSDPRITRAIGENGENLVARGFSRSEFIQRGEGTNIYGEKEWKETDHDLDFIFEKDGIAYGIEVKNTLGYMELDEIKVKVKICSELGLKPVFAVRMLPKSWVFQHIASVGGFALIMKYQMYPSVLSDLALQIKNELGLPVDTPRSLQEGTMRRFTNWHERNLDESGELAQ